jgi:hypothetical protein
MGWNFVLFSPGAEHPPMNTHPTQITNNNVMMGKTCFENLFDFIFLPPEKYP